VTHSRTARRWPARWPVQPVPRQLWSAQRPTFREASPPLIEAAAKRAQARPSGNWFAFAASSQVRGDRPLGTRVAGRELVAWRDRRNDLVVGPGQCPHLGAPLEQGRVVCDALVCRWHGLPVDAGGGSGWDPLPGHDDGVLAWVRLDGPGGEAPLPEPVLAPRPEPMGSVAAVTRLVGVCEPGDVVANRLDPWHGAWFHPYSFAHLEVVSAPAMDAPGDDDRFVVDVTFRVGPGFGVPVRAEFRCPEPRTVCMSITAGEGVGSVVETHATPLGSGPDGRPRTAVLEATIATSERTGFALARRAALVLRPLMRRAAARLWRDDLAYAERRYALRESRSDFGHT
jgi:nitrite reductase/ring-hydroxylating ferredoxin subunit